MLVPYGMHNLVVTATFAKVCDEQGLSCPSLNPQMALSTVLAALSRVVSLLDIIRWTGGHM